jgi:hypothetical protein
MFAERDIVLNLEPELRGVEVQRFCLVVDKDASHVDPHFCILSLLEVASDYELGCLFERLEVKRMCFSSPLPGRLDQPCAF